MREQWDRIRPWVTRLVLYPLFFIFCFVICVYVTFPYERLKDSVVAAVEAPKPGPGGVTTASNIQLNIGSLGPTFLPGLRASNISVTFLPSKPTERSVVMRIQEARVRIGVLSLLSGTLDADFNIEGLGGTIQGHVKMQLNGPRPGPRDITATLDHVRLGELGPLVSLVGLPLFGTASGTVEVHVPDGRFDQTTGSVRLTTNDMRVGDGRAQYPLPGFSSGLTIEQIRVGALTAQISIRNGIATIDRLQSQSPEFQLAGDGRITLRPTLGDSLVNLGLRFTLTDAYRTKSPLAERIMFAITNNQGLQQARRASDNMYGFRCSGTFTRGVNCPPDTRGGASARPGAVPPTRRGF